MPVSTDPSSTPFPPAPWRMSGQMWVGGFRADAPPPLAHGLRPLLDPRRLMLMLLRYQAGTLVYDELAVGSLVRVGLRPGLFVHYIWVDDDASLRGGRQIWGVPKQLASFEWSGSAVRVTDEQGTIAAIDTGGPARWAPRVWFPAPAIGVLGDRWAYMLARFTARLRPCRLHLSEWSSRFAFGLANQPAFSFAGDDFRVIVPPPVLLERSR